VSFRNIAIFGLYRKVVVLLERRIATAADGGEPSETNDKYNFPTSSDVLVLHAFFAIFRFLHNIVSFKRAIGPLPQKSMKTNSKQS
jgi:hypothetical protein